MQLMITSTDFVSSSWLPCTIALVMASRTAMLIPKAASSVIPQLWTRSATAAAASLTASMWLGKTSRVVCSVTKGAAFLAGIAVLAAAIYNKTEDGRVTCPLAACQEVGPAGSGSVWLWSPILRAIHGRDARHSFKL